MKAYVLLLLFVSGCSNLTNVGELTFEEDMMMSCSWHPDDKLVGCEEISCPSTECDNNCGKNVTIYFDSNSKECKEIIPKNACECPPYSSLSECEKFCIR